MQMASIHRQPNRPCWFCAFIDSDGTRRFKSTKTGNRKQALRICQAWEQAAERGKAGKLSPEEARDVIARGVADLFVAANQEEMPSDTIRNWCNSWLKAKEIETGEHTFVRYKGLMDRFLKFLDTKADKNLAMLRSSEVAAFRDQLVKDLSKSSANLAVTVLRACLATAVKRGMITSNFALSVDKLKVRGESKRRPFTTAELKRVLNACGDSEWKGMVLFAIYTGQRLGDLSRLTWRAVNLAENEIAFTTRKTGRRMVLPLAKPLQDYLSELPAPDDPDAPIFPMIAKAADIRVGTLSNQFYDILVEAGLAEPRKHRKTAEGRDAARPVSEISFHSLRHTATTFLKAAGVSDALAREIIGHDSEAVSRGYTHLSTADLRKAIDKLPDLSKDKEKRGSK
ncbi:MAG: tyrosine-type recombinase/integrase [Verrucomicrobiia bacterium]